MEVRRCGNRTRPRVRRRLRVTKPGGQDEGRGALGGNEADALGDGRGSEQGTASQQPAARQRDELRVSSFDHFIGKRE
jgi:hypothetical protein